MTDKRFVHGMRSERRIAPLARTQKRLFLRRNGLSVSKLSGEQLSHLNTWARCTAVARLGHDYLDQVGLFSEEGKGALRVLATFENSGRLAMSRLSEELRLAQTPEGSDFWSEVDAALEPKDSDE